MKETIAIGGFLLIRSVFTLFLGWSAPTPEADLISGISLATIGLVLTWRKLRAQGKSE